MVSLEALGRLAHTVSRVPSGSLLGLVGIGHMGGAMALNLLKHKHKVLVYDKNPAAADKLCKLGASKVSSPAEMVTTPGLEAVITMLPSSQAAREAYLGPDGLLSPGGGEIRPYIFIDSSTIDPFTSKELSQQAEGTLLNADAARAHNTQYPYMVDAPVSGGVAGAESGTLTFMAAKVCNNLVLAVSMAGLSEALALGVRLGLDPALLTTIFNTSSARCWSSEVYNPCPGVQEGVPSSRGYRNGFSASLMVKDLGLAHTAAEHQGMDLPMTDQVYSLYRKVQERDPSLDFSAIFKEVYKGGK